MKTNEINLFEIFLIVLVIINLLCFSIFIQILQDFLRVPVSNISCVPNLTPNVTKKPVLTPRPPINYIESEVKSVNLTDRFGILELSCETGNLRMIVDVSQAISILNALNNITSSRPNTHDLVSNIINSTSLQVAYVTIDKLVNNTYYGTIYLTDNSNFLRIDSRPSDAIAIALRTGSKIYINRGLCRPPVHF